MSESGQTYGQQTKKSGSKRFLELGPARITAVGLVIVALAAAGFFAGRLTASPKASPTSPPVVITKTVTAPAAVAASSPGAAPSDTGTATATSNGTEVASYTFTMTANYTAPLGTTKPTLAQMAAYGSGGSYDIEFSSEFGALYSASGDQMRQLPSGSTPTYAACTASTLVPDNEPADPGVAFCINENSGLMAGVTVVTTGVSPTSVTLKVTLWKNVS
jgi:hypothetical protein